MNERCASINCASIKRASIKRAAIVGGPESIVGRSNLHAVAEEKCRAWPGIFLLSSFSGVALRCDSSAGSRALPRDPWKLVCSLPWELAYFHHLHHVLFLLLFHREQVDRNEYHRRVGLVLPPMLRAVLLGGHFARLMHDRHRAVARVLDHLAGDDVDHRGTIAVTVPRHNAARLDVELSQAEEPPVDMRRLLRQIRRRSHDVLDTLRRRSAHLLALSVGHPLVGGTLARERRGRGKGERAGDHARDEITFES